MNKARINKILNQIPTHVILIATILIWIVPTLGLLITSLRPVQAINQSGWWTVSNTSLGGETYSQFCASCHGENGKKLPAADLSNPELVTKFPRSIQLLATLRKDINGQPHMGTTPLPSAQEAADIAVYLKQLAGIVTQSKFTLNNYIDAIVGYRGTNNYVDDCAAGNQAPDIHCNASDILKSARHGARLC